MMTVAGREHVVRIVEGDVLVAAKQLQRHGIEIVKRHDGVGLVVRDRCRERVAQRVALGRGRRHRHRRVAQPGELPGLIGAQGGDSDRVVLLEVVAIDRQSRDRSADLELVAGIDRPIRAAELVQGPQVQPVVGGEVLHRLIEPAVLGVPAPGGRAGVPDQGERLRGPHRVVLADAVGEQRHVAPDGEAAVGRGGKPDIGRP